MLITKYAAVIIDDQNRFLIVKEGSEDFWKNVGGKPEEGETPEDCLKREIQEELNVKVLGTPEHYFDCPITPAASDPTLSVQIILYRVYVEGDVKASSEIGEIHWLTKREFGENKYNLTSQLKQFIVPRLIEDNLLKD